MPGRLRYVGRYIIEDRTLGKGNFAVVELATHSITKTKVAIKVIDRTKIREEYVRDNLYREARILAQLRHPNVVRLYETISSSSLYCLVTEYAGGGDLLSFVRGQREGKLSESVARPFVRQLVSALHHLHERGVVHRDLKMENIMLDDKRKNLKIVDFGLSNTFSGDCLLKTHCGSPEYAAPELFISDQEYGPEVDIWSLGINMFAMVTGRLPFSTPYTENRRERLMHQIQNGLGVIHGKEMAHLTQECEELLSQLIEPSPELRLPLLDIEIHPWITRLGNLPFNPYQQPHKDVELKKMIIDKMACLLNVTSAKIEANVHEYRHDDISAMYNLMMDQHRFSKGFWDMDHTIRREVKRPKTVEVVVKPQLPPPVQEEQKDPEEGHIELRTPTVIGMVRPSHRHPARRTCLSADFELSAISSDKGRKQSRAKTASFPQSGAKTRPFGNATTANSVIARYNNFGPPTSSTQQSKVYSCPPVSPTNNSIPVSHSCTPEQPVEPVNGNIPEQAALSNEPASKQEEPPEGGEDDDKPLLQQCDKKALRKMHMFGADGHLLSKDDRVSQLKTNAESAHDVKVIDMARYFNFKHGYIIKETQLASSNIQRVQETHREDQDEHKPPQLCSMHQDHIEAATSKQDNRSSGCSSRTNSPSKSASKRNELLRQQMQLPTRPVNAHFCPHHTNPNLQKTMLLTKRAWQTRYSQQSPRTGRKAKESSGQHSVVRSRSSPSGQHCACCLPKSRCESSRMPLQAPVASLHSTGDSRQLSPEQAWHVDKAKSVSVQGNRGKNAMPRRLDWKRNGSGKSRSGNEVDDIENKVVSDDGRGTNNVKKLQEMMSKDDVHQRIPNGTIRLQSAKMKTPIKAERSQSPERRNTSGSSTRRTPSSDLHKSCTAQPFKGPYILDKRNGSHKRNKTYPASNRDGVVDLSRQHMVSLVQEASVKFEDSLRKAEKKKQHEVLRSSGNHHDRRRETKPNQGKTHRTKNKQQSRGDRPLVSGELQEGTVALQLGQRVHQVKGSIAIKSKPAPVLSSKMAPEHVFNVDASRNVHPDHQKLDKSKQTPHSKGMKEWDAGYHLERKVSDTIKRDGCIIKHPDMRQIMADVARERLQKIIESSVEKDGYHGS